MIELLVGAACYLAFYAAAPVIGPAMQAAAVVLLFGAAAYAVLMNRVKPLPVSLTELVMYVVGLAYIALGMFREEDAMTAMAISLERLLDIGAMVALLCVLTAIVVDHQKALAALLPGPGGIGLDRFMPLGTNPALVGYIFGSGSILMLRRVIISDDTKQRLVMAGGSLLASLFVLAASARSSLVALAAAAFLAITFEVGVTRFFSLRWVRVVGIASIIFGLAFAGKIGSYFSRMLDLESTMRGVGSGATGRTELW